MGIQREGTIQSHAAPIGDPETGADIGDIIGWSLGVMLDSSQNVDKCPGKMSWVLTLLARNQRPNKISNGVLEC